LWSTDEGATSLEGVRRVQKNLLLGLSHFRNETLFPEAPIVHLWSITGN